MMNTIFARWVTPLLLAAGLCACTEGNGPSGNEFIPGDGWPGAANEYSWDGSWNPSSSELPPDGLYDEIYFDGHDVEGSPSPILPPGEWDYEEIHLLANWNNFEQNLGEFEELMDNADLPFGWRLLPIQPEGTEATALLQYFHGSGGADVVDLGSEGSIHSAGNPAYGDPIGLGDGPDMLRFRTGYSGAVRTGSSATGSLRDNDLAIFGSGDPLDPGEYDLITFTVHTGPGSDLVMASNWERAAVDLGNGDDGRTDAVDPHDGPDMVVIEGNARDFRVFGGNGGDVFVWRVDEVNQEPDTWLGPNFFGGGGWGDAVWGGDGVDRLILDIPPQTQIVSEPADLVDGSLLVMTQGGYEPVIDTPTEEDPYARYYVTVPEGPNGEKTLTLQYKKSDGSVDTAYFYVTAVELLQLGSDAGSPVYSLDPVVGTATLDDSADPITNIPTRSYCEELFDTFGY